MKILGWGLVAGGLVLAAACAEAPTAPTREPAAPRFGGHTLGGGNVADTTTTTSATVGGSAELEGGGYTLGGGQLTEAPEPVPPQP